MPLVEVAVENSVIQVAVSEQMSGGDVYPPVSAALTYDELGRLSTITTVYGTKTMTYNPDGTLASITGTGAYPSKAFTYSGGKLVAITVS